MDYIALLRGINVGTSVKINMKELKTLFAFTKANKQNWFETALFDGVLSEKVNV